MPVGFAERRRRNTVWVHSGRALLLALSLLVLGVGVYVLVLPEEASGRPCGGDPIAVLSRHADKECHESAAESVALGFGVIGCGAVMGVASFAAGGDGR
jgi:hypothetical protein